ncbi:unnamed protein product [Thelazia callipaeda]|uniref:Activin_recp domain-containing protein n=1 Tax=Thelazia callipaeda TaxID=103827 RepID=A0A0N5CYS4_THECL|nr:unnamed protein product [Thelazia callipaeda]
MTCTTKGGNQQDAVQLDKFRVTAQLSRPSCAMEPIHCDRDQDVCVTITMHVGSGHYWIGAGCDRHEHFQHIACENVRTLTRNVQPGVVQERPVLQRVCVCTNDRCNAAKQSYLLQTDKMPYFTILACSFLVSYFCHSFT